MGDALAAFCGDALALEVELAQAFFEFGGVQTAVRGEVEQPVFFEAEFFELGVEILVGVTDELGFVGCGLVHVLADGIDEVCG